MWVTSDGNIAFAAHCTSPLHKQRASLRLQKFIAARGFFIFGVSCQERDLSMSSVFIPREAQKKFAKPNAELSDFTRRLWWRRKRRLSTVMLLEPHEFFCGILIVTCKSRFPSFVHLFLLETTSRGCGIMNPKTTVLRVPHQRTAVFTLYRCRGDWWHLHNFAAKFLSKRSKIFSFL